MSTLYFWAAGAVVGSVFLSMAPRRSLFLLVLLPALVCFVGVWVEVLAAANCGDHCPAGQDIAMGMTGLVGLATTLIFVPVVLIKALVLHRRRS